MSTNLNQTVLAPYFNASVEKNSKGYNYAFDAKHCATEAEGKALVNQAVNVIQEGIIQSQKVLESQS